jgi:hypothetical protein
MRLFRLVRTIALLALLALGALLLWGHFRTHPEDLPWSPLDLSDPVGMFTGRKLAGLAEEGPRCAALLRQAGIRFDELPPRRESAQCGYDEAVRFRAGGALAIGYRPASLGTACPVAAALALWEWHVVQPAAIEHFGTQVAAVEHFGSYSCRRLYGRSEGAWSEHASANAVDIAGFRLRNGRQINVLRDWEGDPAEAAFLRDVRDGACRLFATVLSPDYNAAHRDHFHFDQAARGEMGWRACR